MDTKSNQSNNACNVCNVCNVCIYVYMYTSVSFLYVLMFQCSILVDTIIGELEINNK
jgi:hypothetical protein